MDELNFNSMIKNIVYNENCFWDEKFKFFGECGQVGNNITIKKKNFRDFFFVFP